MILLGFDIRYVGGKRRRRWAARAADRRLRTDLRQLRERVAAVEARQIDQLLKRQGYPMTPEARERAKTLRLQKRMVQRLPPR